ncbi:helix-turn-helix transcriptional regulator [Cellulomonas sp. NPDC057328]|uniref:helix-turn-helix transcriptional regulator n=1 Tax=Cellulomonas sp. NPDC057328 TaxID=3346101 RepID=UPI00362E6138
MPPATAPDVTTLAHLLRSWRDRLSPGDVGLAAGARRRAPGLRREELAQLAGLSVDYLLRLEQGRATHPSPQVVAALARSLQLSRTERDRLHRAAGLLPPQDSTVSAHVPAGVQRLVARLGDVPVAVFAADWTLLTCNALWTALHGDPAALLPRDRNLARALFGDGDAHAARHPTTSANGTDAFEAAVVADLRDTAARYPADARLRGLLDDLLTSPRFAALWRAATPAPHTTDRKTVVHPVVGALTLDCDVLGVPGADLRVVAYTAAGGTPDADALDLLRVTGGQGVTTARS